MKTESINKSSGDKPIEIQITPDTKISTLLTNFPELEAVLEEMSPAFKKLKNSILRKTVAKITSLRQAAQIGNLKLGVLINTLRKAAGQGEISLPEGGSSMQDERVEELDRSRIKREFDARQLIESGGHPLNRVLEEIEGLKSGEIYLLITPFLPAPLIEIVKSRGFTVRSENSGDDECRTYIKS